MRGVDDAGRLLPESDAMLQRMIGELADEDDIVLSYIVVAVVQGTEEIEPATMLVVAPHQPSSATLGLAQYAVVKMSAWIADESREEDDDG